MDVTGPLVVIGIGLVVFLIGLLAGYLATKARLRKRLPRAAGRGAGSRSPGPVPTRREEKP
jgi:hypothetical protein